MHHSPSIRYFQLAHTEVHPPQEQDRPLRALFVTSVRDTGSCDRNGTTVQTPEGTAYMRGLIEASVQFINDGSDLSRYLNVVGVAYDDTPRDLARSDYPVRPQHGQPWIYPLDLRNEATGESMLTQTYHVPSEFRMLPRHDLEGRAEMKAAFEAEIAKLMHQLSADVIISDHLMLRIVRLIRSDVHQLYGRVLNIHPAMTHEAHPFRLRGMTPTQDAIDRANGFRQIHGTGLREPIHPYGRTGATLHFVSPEIDAGPVIADAEPTPVYATDTPQQLRVRNYERAKIPVFVEGFRHYARNMFPFLQNDSSLLTIAPHAVSHSIAA